MSARVYAQLNKETLKFIRDKRQVSFDYIERKTKFSKSQITLWEDETSNKLPTIRQAKDLARCYHVPFAGFYMNSSDINVKHLPRLMNKRTMIGAMNDDSVINLAVIDLINERDFFVETKEFLGEAIPLFKLQIPDAFSVSEWASIIREYFDINLLEQFHCNSKRKFYLYIREKIESKGIFIQGFQDVEVSILRGIAIIDELMPIIGINDKDRYPAKTFSIVHELVHVIKRTSSICNDMLESNPLDNEEIFCNAVAGEVLVPKDSLYSVAEKFFRFSLEEVDFMANKFSVSSEVIARRLFDTGKCGKTWYERTVAELSQRFYNEREKQRMEVKMGRKKPPKRNMPREAIDRTSSSLCDVLLNGYSAGIFDKADISVHIRIDQKHVNKFISEVLGWHL